MLTLKCTKFDLRWSSVHTPLGGLTALPRPLAVFNGAYFYGDGGGLRGRRGEGSEREGEGKRRGRGGKEEGKGMEENGGAGRYQACQNAPAARALNLRLRWLRIPVSAVPLSRNNLGQVVRTHVSLFIE